MDEIKRVSMYIRSCINAGIDCTVTIDKAKTHSILQALEKQIVEYPLKEYWSVEYDSKIDTCPRCKNQDIYDEDLYCSKCGQRLKTKNMNEDIIKK